MNTTNFYESLNALVTDSRFRSLAVTQNFESFLGHTGIDEAENMHTFSWFLQPKGSHGLQDTFLKEFFTATWSMINGQYGEFYKGFKTSKFYTTFSPVYFQQMSFTNAFIDKEFSKTFTGADLVITDVNSKTMMVINNHFDKTACDKIITHFNSEKFNFFERKVFVTFDTEAYFAKDTNWMFMNNEWIINLCADLIEAPQYANMKINGHLRDFYQFLTGCQYGTSHEQMAQYSASLVADYYHFFTQFKTFKAEKIPTINLVDINPRDYASLYFGKISEQEYGVLSLYWSYQNTFKTFFELSDFETVTRDLTKEVEKKSFGFDRTFTRNGLRFTPFFNKTKSERTFFNTIFDVEMVGDMSKNLTMNLVINKDSWDKLTTFQRETIQKNFGFSGMISHDRAIVWNSFYKQGWKQQNLSKDVFALFEKVDQYLSTLGMKVA